MIPDDPERVRLLEQSLQWAKQVHGSFEIVGMPASGSYNDHRVLRTSRSGDVVLRIRLAGVRELDSRPLSEFSVLTAAGHDPGVRDHVPEAIAHNPDLGCSLYSFAGDEVLDDIAPKMTPLPGDVLRGLPGFMAALASLEPESSWVEAQASYDASMGLVGAHTTYDLNVACLMNMYTTLHRDNPGAMTTLGMPSEVALAGLLSGSVSGRRPVVIHGDIHRKNMRIDRRSDSWFLLDWEMAQIGDAVYDLAVALWKLKLTGDDQQAFLARWEALMPEDTARGWAVDVQTYETLERLKTAIVHIYRTADALRFTALSDVDQRSSLAALWMADRAAVNDQLGQVDLRVDDVVSVLESIR